MAEPDPDQDLLNKLDRRQRKSDLLRMAPALGLALAAGLAVFALARFRMGWDGETAFDIGGLVCILGACLAYFWAGRDTA